MSTDSKNRIAEVLVDQRVDRPLDYAIPEEMQGLVAVGSRVEIPLRGKHIQGFISGLKSESSFGEPKPISRLVDANMISPDLFKLAIWMAQYYVTPLRKVLQILLPGSVRRETKAKEQYFVTRAKSLEELSHETRALREKGSSQALLLDVMLKASKGMLLSELLEKSGVTRSPVDTLVKKGFLNLSRLKVDRSPLVDEEYFRTKPKVLNPEQTIALKKITDDLDQSKFSVQLLWGVTGSGKTEVYLQGIDHALKQGKGAIILVPEISLTEQTIERFRSRFEGHIAILHHRLSEGERHDEWQRIKKKEARIVIGARSSIFSPIPDLGLIILDEEHETSYKQSDEQPRYHAREVAIMRAKMTNAVVLLGSATPSIESFHNAKAGKYILSELKGRADSQRMPSVVILDMKREYEKNGGYTLFSSQLITGIKERIKLGEQTILFLNRRGYHSCMTCQGCGEAMRCKHCDVTLTFHKGEKQLACHLCGYHLAPPSSCPTCKTGSPMKFKGVGTEQAEAALKAILPEVRVLRMDADTTKHKGSHSRLFREFGRGKADVLIGTQMIAKGLHFPEVTLVGVLSCDTTLNIPDFRSSETTFQLLTQVAGRAGRGVRPGEVILQTMLPDNPTIKLAAEQDFASFYKDEIESRKLFSYPPYSHLIKIASSSPFEKKGFDTLELLRKKISAHLPADYELMPTLPAGHAKVKDLYRFHFLIRGPQILPLIRTLSPIIPLFQEIKDVKVSIDVGPLSTYF